ncbi:hypothetical protein R3I93_019903 [Phoxinus phoxinus]|uniref:Uncharacterized protein n=1 Tax=Phoxinus phoxinus TaxID=58324 RepID=A0AAN9CDK0_9TELE
MDVAECEDMAQTTFCGDLVQPAEHVKDTKNKEVVPKKKGRKSCQKTRLPCEECAERTSSGNFLYSKILKKRGDLGFIRWCPCATCGTKWKDSWEPLSCL